MAKLLSGTRIYGSATIDTTLSLGTSAIFNGSTSGTTTVLATAVAGTTTLTLPAATDTLVGRATTDTLTNKTLTSPILTTPTLGVASATSINKVTITAPTTGSTLAVADGKTFTVNNTITLAGTDSTTITLPSTTGTVALNNQTFYLGTTSIAINRSSASQSLTGITSIDGSAATLTTARAIYGNSFDGSAALTQIIASTYGGTGNGFTKFSGATTAEKTYTLPDATTTILTTNAAVTPAQGGTGVANNASSTLTISGAFGTTLTVSGTTAITLPTSGTLATINGTETLTNKRVTPRVSTTTSSATPTINTDNVDMYGLTAQAVNITSFTTNLSGTPTDGQKLWIYIVGTAARTILWGAKFEASTVALPTTTVTTNRLDVGFVWNAASSVWRCVAVA